MKHGPAQDPPLDARGLPMGYRFQPDWEITPRDVQAMRERGEAFTLIDCRLPSEYAITHIEGTTLLPLQELGRRYQELMEHVNDPIVVHCRSGVRSLQFAQALRNAGFTNVRSMAGGILLWNRDIQPGRPQY